MAKKHKAAKVHTFKPARREEEQLEFEGFTPAGVKAMTDARRTYERALEDRAAAARAVKDARIRMRSAMDAAGVQETLGGGWIFTRVTPEPTVRVKKAKAARRKALSREAEAAE